MEKTVIQAEPCTSINRSWSRSRNPAVLLRSAHELLLQFQGHWGRLWHWSRLPFHLVVFVGQELAKNDSEQVLCEYRKLLKYSSLSF